MILVWTPRAERDLDGIRRYVERDNPAAALALSDLIHSKAALLVDHPRIGRRGRRPGTRELIVHPSYVPIYGVNLTSVRILRVMHAARNWPPRRP